MTNLEKMIEKGKAQKLVSLRFHIPKLEEVIPERKNVVLVDSGVIKDEIISSVIDKKIKSPRHVEIDNIELESPFLKMGCKSTIDVYNLSKTFKYDSQKKYFIFNIHELPNYAHYSMLISACVSQVNQNVPVLCMVKNLQEVLNTQFGKMFEKGKIGGLDVLEWGSLTIASTDQLTSFLETKDFLNAIDSEFHFIFWNIDLKNGDVTKQISIDLISKVDSFSIFANKDKLTIMNLKNVEMMYKKLGIKLKGILIKGSNDE